MNWVRNILQKRPHTSFPLMVIAVLWELSTFDLLPQEANTEKHQYPWQLDLYTAIGGGVRFNVPCKNLHSPPKVRVHLSSQLQTLTAPAIVLASRWNFTGWFLTITQIYDSNLIFVKWKFHENMIKNIMKNTQNVSLPWTMIHSSYQCYNLAGCFTTSTTERIFEKYQIQIVIFMYLPLLSVDSVIFWCITKYTVKTWSRCGVFIVLWYKAPSRSWI